MHCCCVHHCNQLVLINGPLCLSTFRVYKVHCTCNINICQDTPIATLFQAMSSESSRSTSRPRLLHVARSTNISEQSPRPYRPSVIVPIYAVPNADPVNRVIVTPLNLVRSTVDLSSTPCRVAESQCIGKVFIKVSETILSTAGYFALDL